MAAVARRPVRPDDAPLLRALFEAGRPDLAALPLPPAQRAQLVDMQFRAQQAHYRQAYPHAEWSIIEADGVPVGCLVTSRETDALRVVDVTLAPAVRGRGLGSQVLAALIAEAGGAVRLSVARDNPARRLYLRLGFVAVSDDGVYLHMERALSGPP